MIADLWACHFEAAMPTIFPAKEASTDQTKIHKSMSPSESPDECHRQPYQTIEISRAAARKRALMAQPQASFRFCGKVPK